MSADNPFDELGPLDWDPPIPDEPGNAHFRYSDPDAEIARLRAEVDRLLAGMKALFAAADDVVAYAVTADTQGDELPGDFIESPFLSQLSDACEEVRDLLTAGDKAQSPAHGELPHG